MDHIRFSRRRISDYTQSSMIATRILISLFTIVAAATPWCAAAPPAGAHHTPSGAAAEAALTTRTGAVAELSAMAGDGATAITTPHFVLVHSADPNAARRMADRLEGLYAAHVTLMTEELGLPVRPPPHRIEVVMFGERDGFLRQRRRDRAIDLGEGYYARIPNRAMFYDLRTHPRVAEALARLDATPTTQPTAQRDAVDWLIETVTRHAFQHEAAHAIQFNIGLFDREADVPLWLAEALAQPFERWEPNAPLRLASHPDRRADVCARFPAPHDLPDLTALVSDNTAWRAEQHQSLAWALGRYLAQTYPEGWRRYVRWTSTLRAARGATPHEWARQFESCFGQPDAAWAARFHASLRCDEVESDPPPAR